ncbi:putative membrane protein, partial [Emiliania huxleyi virus 145]
MEYKIIIIIIQSVLLFVIFSVLLYLLFGRGQAFMPPIDETTLTLLDTFKMTNNLGIFESLYGEDMSLDEKQVAVADAYNLLDYHASMIK